MKNSRKKPSIAMNKKKTTSCIPVKDQKILWSRAAGRCSMENCRKRLTLDSEDGGAKTLGEMCHIVGEKKTSPRGKSPLNNKERNSYSNLILLCAHHHKKIDQDKLKYPIEVLHAIKDNHEQWVDSTLGSHQVDPDELVYADLIDSLTIILDLDRWWWFIDNAVRDLVPIEIADAQGAINRMRLGAVWPQKKPALKKVIIRLLDAFDEYIGHYMENADLLSNNNQFYSPDRSYRRFNNPKYEEYEEKENVWSGVNFWLLCNYCLKLNQFANAVRKYFNPLFYRTHGKFLVSDSMGYRFGGKDMLYDPALPIIRNGLKKYNYKPKSV